MSTTDKPRKDHSRVNLCFTADPVNSPIQHCSDSRARLISVTFRSDHIDLSGNKLLKNPGKLSITAERWLIEPSGKLYSEQYDHPSYYGDGFTEFAKPEWRAPEGGSAVSQPISHTKNLPIKLELELELERRSANISNLRGNSSDGLLTFHASINQTYPADQSITIKDIESAELLPNYVTQLEFTISWTIEIDGTTCRLGTSGTHTVYITYDTPGGAVESPSSNLFCDGGVVEQIVTEPRLYRAIAWANGSGKLDEKECVDQIFANLDIAYFGSRRWDNYVDATGISPKPSFYHYLWLCNAGIARGECHNLAASFALACKMVGVKGKFEFGLMYPFGSRSDQPPEYPKRGDARLGRYENPNVRVHASEGHDREILNFFDGNDVPNNFEGVAKFGKALYALGEVRLDFFTNDDDNASSYFAMIEVDLVTRAVLSCDRTKGRFVLAFFKEGTPVMCDKPYPWSSGPYFRWEN